jgi:hypothetical protein
MTTDMRNIRADYRQLFLFLLKCFLLIFYSIFNFAFDLEKQAPFCLITLPNDGLFKSGRKERTCFIILSPVSTLCRVHAVPSPVHLYCLLSTYFRRRGGDLGHTIPMFFQQCTLRNVEIQELNYNFRNHFRSSWWFKFNVSKFLTHKYISYYLQNTFSYHNYQFCHWSKAFLATKGKGKKIYSDWKPYN